MASKKRQQSNRKSSDKSRSEKNRSERCVAVPRNQDSRKPSDSSESSEDITKDIFVGNIAKATSKRDLMGIFSKFGKIRDLKIYDKKPEVREFPKFAFINFKSSDAVLQALKADGMIEISGNNLHVEERRPRGQAETYNLQQLDSFWNDLVRNFDWRRSAAVYVLRKWTMEDFLRDFIVNYACAREVNDESVEALLNKLVKMSETKPESLQETLPPNLSGMIYNLVHEGKSDSKKKFVDILKDSPNLFDLNDKKGYVKYCSLPLTKTEASNKLNEILVEGVFIYFLAKFCHGPMFKIKYTYYVKSEPIKSVLMGITGQRHVNAAVQSYFEAMKDVFDFDADCRELKLVEDYYFSPKFREGLEKYLTLEPTTTEITNVEGRFKFIQGEQAGIEFKMKDQDLIAALERKDFKSSKDQVRVGDAIRFNAVFDGEDRQWHCIVAWIPGSRLHDMKGEVHNGVIKFTAPDGSDQEATIDNTTMAVATFNDDDVVSFDADPMENGYKATLVWNHDEARPTVEGIISCKMDRRLENMKKKRRTSHMLDDLPDNVQSVLNDVFMNEEDEDDMIHLSNFDVVDCILDDLQVSGSLVSRPMIMEMVEKEVKQSLCKVISSIIGK